MMDPNSKEVKDKISMANLPLSVKVVVTDKNQKPCLELRRVTTNVNLIKAIVSAAYHGQPLIIMPEFTDKMASIATLIDKGILYYDAEVKEYRYAI